MQLGRELWSCHCVSVKVLEAALRKEHQMVDGKKGQGNTQIRPLEIESSAKVHESLTEGFELI